VAQLETAGRVTETPFPENGNWRDPMRLLVINPNTTLSMTEDIGRTARKYARPGTEVVAISPAHGPRSIEGHFEESVAAAATVEEVIKNRDAYDAFVIACYGDPGLYACREVTNKPVIGIAEASMRLAAFVAHSFSIVSVMPRVKPLLEDLVRLVGMESRCASIRCLELSVLGIDQDPEWAVQGMIDQAKAAVEEDGAESILLGCAGMGPLEERMRAELDVPVLDGVVSAVKIAEALHDCHLSTSKIAAFAWPEAKEMVGGSEALRLGSMGAVDGRVGSVRPGPAS
jgi:allantoin racemase